MKILIQDLDAKGGQLKETGEKLALTSARWSQANIIIRRCFYNVYNVYKKDHL